ncbi:MAG: hypothetical protein QOI56_459 [Actinomycetota bacterium]|jgi:hypothetical protein|nr:hypothetical protein [Actinomycetota bacterium]MEA2931674.1 hypothetical protein [Actinomycetota bacterium]
MPDAPKAASISLDALSGAVEKAVSEVLGGHNLQASKGLAFGPGTLIGRQLRGAVTDVATIERAAADMTAHVQKTLGASAGRTLSPAASIQGGHILVGFIAQGSFQQG